MTTVQIDFITDFICPWCYIGKARLERVRNLLSPEIQLDINISPYLLYPNIPEGGTPKSNFAKKVKPGMGKALKAEAALEDIAINYKNIERIPRSLEAHRLIELVRNNDQKWQLSKWLFTDYFENGQNLEDLDYLVAQGKRVGMPKSILSEFLFTQKGEASVRAKIQSNKEAFISIVPTLRLDGQFVIPGLQAVDVWEKYIRRAAEIQQTKDGNHPTTH